MNEKIERYDLSEYDGMIPYNNGDYVKYDDYIKLKQYFDLQKKRIQYAHDKLVYNIIDEEPQHPFDADMAKSVLALVISELEKLDK